MLNSNKLITKSRDYDFLQPWLGTGLLTRLVISNSPNFIISRVSIESLLKTSLLSLVGWIVKGDLLTANDMHGKYMKTNGTKYMKWG